MRRRSVQRRWEAEFSGEPAATGGGMHPEQESQKFRPHNNKRNRSNCNNAKKLGNTSTASTCHLSHEAPG